jgi:hypothetical protein
VTVWGTNFLAGATVSFGGVAAASVTVTSATQLGAVTPPHATGVVDVRVTNLDDQFATLVAGFTYGTPPPTITSVSPNSGTIAGGTSVTITGTGFQPGVPGTTVTFGSVAASGVNVIGSTQIHAMTPAHDAGSVDVRVANPDTQSATRVGGYVYVSGTAPTISSLSVDSGLSSGGTPVTITGSNFAGDATVTFGTLLAASVTVVSPTRIDGTTPSQAAGSIVDVTVTNPDTQQGTLPNAFRYGTILLSSSFETGDFSEWYGYYQHNANVNSVITGTPGGDVHSGTKAYRIHFVICGVDVPAATTLSQTGGSHPGTYYVRYTYYTTDGFEGALHPGQTKASVEQSFTVTAGNDLTVASPPAATGLTGWNVYISSSSGTEVLQNGTPIAIGTNWTQNVALLTGTASPPSTDTACGGTSQDNNQAVVQYFDVAHGWPNSNGFQHFFVRAYVKFHVNVGGQSIPQRKLFFISGFNGSTRAYDIVLSTNLDQTLNWRWADQANPACTGFVAMGFETLGTFLLDTWYYLEMETRINDSGVNNGIARIWVAQAGHTPTLILNQTSLNYKVSDPGCGNFPTSFQVGMQANRIGVKTNIVDEDRYWDDVVIGDAYIGPQIPPP